MNKKLLYELTGLDPELNIKELKSYLHYFINLSFYEICEVLIDRFSIFSPLYKEFKKEFLDKKNDSAIVELASLILAIQEHKCPSKKFYRKTDKKSVITDHEFALAQSLLNSRKKSSPKFDWLKDNFLVIKRLRLEGLSYRQISKFLYESRKINISHSTIRRFYEANKNIIY